MFDNRYYKNKFIIEEEGLYTFCEANIIGDTIEFFIYKIDDNGKLEIFLRKKEKIKCMKNKVISLKDFLSIKGYTDSDFNIPFNKTERIVKVINKINTNNKEKVKQKISH